MKTFLKIIWNVGWKLLFFVLNGIIEIVGFKFLCRYLPMHVQTAISLSVLICEYKSVNMYMHRSQLLMFIFFNCSFFFFFFFFVEFFICIQFIDFSFQYGHLKKILLWLSLYICILCMSAVCCSSLHRICFFISTYGYLPITL